MTTSANTQDAKTNPQGTMTTSHRFFNMHKTEQRHPERSEGSLNWYSAENIVFIMFEVQRFFGQGPQNDRVAVCGY